MQVLASTEYVPRGQLVQAEAPLVEENVPALHLLQNPTLYMLLNRSVTSPWKVPHVEEYTHLLVTYAMHLDAER